MKAVTWRGSAMFGWKGSRIVLELVTHTVPIDEAPGMYKTFQQKADGGIKVVITY